ncbi:sirohydrochlorin chelatase [Streptomonospora wellingtoniae]|uniref:CbiX/SirB N-terminal domain-containing protein n=1 Tax=Streptomonospora wellingtoniae TaxID=3075544 RepID=A0ABU2KR34_9ACTN|nr:CbiX/SirB N-terminal domain-containing protein [Streptomonospora sp. DSM 45055]MDT0301676.1 CbiX/SirB N-terminal domain-containing protein [Streptomonospora sp. DSM 45055]
MVPTMVLVADDSQDTGRTEALQGLADAVAQRGEARVVPAFGSGGEVRRAVDSVEGPMVVVPAFVAGGDFASSLVFSDLDLEGRFDACPTAPLGAVPSIVADLAGRLVESGWSSDDGVVLAADGSTGQEERQSVTDVARMLSRRLGSPVQVGYLNSWAPSVGDAVERLRRNGRDRVAVAAWRLVEGRDYERLHEMGATSVTAPLWPSEIVVDSLLAQHRAAKARLAA